MCTRKKIQDKTLFLLFFLPESSAVDNCLERMHVVDAEAPRPPRIETAVESWMGVETAVEMAVESWSGMGVETAVEVTM